MAAEELEFVSDVHEAEDDIEQINREYYMRGWSDGLPIADPGRVQRMLKDRAHNL